jgi:hypothetical protein
VYGAINEKGVWKEYEIDWLLNLKTPLYIAVVDKRSHTISLYNTTVALFCYWEPRPKKPSLIKLIPREFPSDSMVGRPPKIVSDSHQNYSGGDGCEHQIDLGNPLVKYSIDDMENQTKIKEIKELLRKGIRMDMRSILFRDYSQPFLNWMGIIRTNESFDAAYISYTPSAVKPLFEASMPTLMAIAIALKKHDPVRYEKFMSISDLFVREKMPKEIIEQLKDMLLEPPSAAGRICRVTATVALFHNTLPPVF